MISNSLAQQKAEDMSKRFDEQKERLETLLKKQQSFDNNLRERQHTFGKKTNEISAYDTSINESL